MRHGAKFLVFACIALTLEAQGDFTTLAARANEARSANRLDQAATLYKQALTMRPAWAEGWWALGTLLYEGDAYADAANAFRKSTALNPRAGIAFVMLGLCEAKLGRAHDALAHIEHGRTLGPGDDPSLRRVMLYTEGALLLSKGDFGKAQETLGLLARDGVTEEDAIFALGLAVLGIKPSDSALSDPSTKETVRQAGWAEHLAARHEIPAAAREYEKLAADAPSFHDVQFAYGRFLLANHDDEKAAAAFEHEIKNTPNHLLARLGIAAIRLPTDPAAGLPYAEQAVKLAPRLSEPHYLLAMLLLKTGSTNWALTELETARSAAPNEAKIYAALGQAYTALNRKEDSLRARATFKRLSQQDTRAEQP